MFTSLSSSSLSHSNNFIPPFSNSYGLTNRRSSTVDLHQLDVHNLNSTKSLRQNDLPSQQTEPFHIPRPTLVIPYSSIHIPDENLSYMPQKKSTHTEQYSSSPNLTIRTHLSEEPFYQIMLPVTPPPLPSPIQYQIVPVHIKQPSPTRTHRYFKRKLYRQEKSPGIYATLCSGGLATMAALIYLTFCLALPITKFVLGIVYLKDCPAEKNIPLYMIVSGACGITLVLLLLLSSSCSYYRSSMIAKRFVHHGMICAIGFARGMQGLLVIFLIIWFFFGNVWVFSAQYRVQTKTPGNPNYCQPTLYRFAFYVLIFTYVYAIFMCALKFFANFLCCRAYDVWKRAFS